MLTVLAEVPAPPVRQSRGGALANFTPPQAELPRHFKLLVDNQVEILGAPIDAAGDETDSDDGDNGDSEEVEPFIPVAGGRPSISSDIIWVVFAADAENFDQQRVRGIAVRFYSACGTEYMGFSTTFSEGR